MAWDKWLGCVGNLGSGGTDLPQGIELNQTYLRDIAFTISQINAFSLKIYQSHSIKIQWYLLIL